MDKALQTMIDNLPEKTGKSLDQWHKLLSQTKLAKHGEIVKFLKSEHGVTHGFANTISALFLKKSETPIDLVAAQYISKQDLLPIFQTIDKYIKSLGTDVTVSPKKNSVSYIRTHQFALVQPSTKTRIDVGLKIKDVDPQGKLESSGPFGSMCSHRIQINDKKDFDEEVKKWITTAYNNSK